ncbi:ABC transporter permease [Microbacterium sp. LRZ72]|uniref:ABC transporter permease n=1 Tax=Microbacterium sp. LRZ72 TaxID=2942481 RepID=UPI0029B99562|nr:ABC transporter permease [Microbacterium sp. LRZ72]MDX2376426.1 ABC transporter permease [Microbacterium sp. LRZ72]
MSLLAATRSEGTKLFSTAGWWILALVLVVYVGSTAGGMAAIFGASASGSLPGATDAQVPSEGLAPVLYSLAGSFGYVFPLLIGTLMVTTEFRHQTLTPTFLTVPRRGTVVWGKVLMGLLAGALFGVVAVVSAVGPAAGVLAAFGLDTTLGTGDTWALIGRTVLALTLWALVGIGVGTLVRNQVVAVVVVLAFTQFLEPLLRLAASFVDGLAEAARFLPGAASDALVGTSIYDVMGAGGTEPLVWWGGGLVLVAYALVLLLIGYITTWTRDVT